MRFGGKSRPCWKNSAKRSQKCAPLMMIKMKPENEMNSVRAWVFISENGPNVPQFAGKMPNSKYISFGEKEFEIDKIEKMKNWGWSVECVAATKHWRHVPMCFCWIRRAITKHENERFFFGIFISSPITDYTRTARRLPIVLTMRCHCGGFNFDNNTAPNMKWIDETMTLAKHSDSCPRPDRYLLIWN